MSADNVFQLPFSYTDEEREAVERRRKNDWISDRLDDISQMARTLSIEDLIEDTRSRIAQGDSIATEFGKYSELIRDDLPAVLGEVAFVELQREYSRRYVRDMLDPPLIRERHTGRDFANRDPIEQPITQVLGVGVNILSGPTEAGKSLLAKDWMLHVAAGVPWRGHAVDQRPVLYIAGEGLHDFEDRWATNPLWGAAADQIYVIEDGVNLLSQKDVKALIDEYADVRPGVVTFDLIYDAGMQDDNGTKDVAPIFMALNRIALAWRSATIAIGHNGHNGERRFRGGSMWRQRALTDYHLGDNTLSCEKSKLGNKSQFDFTGGYVVEYPNLRWLSPMEVVTKTAIRELQIEEAVRQDAADHPTSTNTERARRLAPALGLSANTLRLRIGQILTD